MSACADANALFFAAHGNMRDTFVFVKKIDQLQHVYVGDAGDEINAGFFEPG
jgi:hypothetical protein